MEVQRALVVEGPLLPSQAAHWAAFSRIGVDLHMVGGLAAPDDDWWTTGEVADITTHVLEPRGWVKRGQHWWVFPGLRDLVQRLQPDVIHVGAEPWALFFSQVLPSRIPTVAHGADNLWVHGSLLETKLRIARARSVLRRLSGYASWNTAGIELAREFGLPPERPTLLAPNRIPDPNPFDHAARSRAEHRAGLELGDQNVVGFVGRLVPEKGLGWLIEALAQAGLPNTLLLVVGSGPLQGHYEELAEQLGLRAQVLGGVDPERMPAIMASFDILVVPSLTTDAWAEQFGRVVMEAMFAGTPVVSSDSGSLPEVVSEAGSVVPENDRPALAAALSDLVRDQSLRTKLGGEGQRRSLESFGPAPLAQRILAFWHEAMKAAAP